MREEGEASAASSTATQGAAEAVEAVASVALTSGLIGFGLAAALGVTLYVL